MRPLDRGECPASKFGPLWRQDLIENGVAGQGMPEPEGIPVNSQHLGVHRLTQCLDNGSAIQPGDTGQNLPVNLRPSSDAAQITRCDAGGSSRNRR